MSGYYGKPPKPTVTGNTDSNTAMASLLSGLSSTADLITNSTTAGTNIYGRQMAAAQIIN